jgi:hypothetical protein
VKRILTPNLNPNGLMALAAAAYALGTAIWNVVHGHGAVDPQVIVSALGAFLAALSRQVVTPVADPRDGNGKSLKQPAEPAA